MGPIRVIWGYTEPNRAKGAKLRQNGAKEVKQGGNGPYGVHIVLYLAKRCPVWPYGTIWDHIGQYGTK